MGRKFFYILTVLLFYLSTANAAGTVNKHVFPIQGGTTSDGIVVSEPVLDGFKMTKKKLNVIEQRKKASMIFTVTVPDGKVAVLNYKVFIKLKKKTGAVVTSSSITFSAKMDDKIVKFHPETTEVQYNSEYITIPSGEHHITLEATYQADFCKMTGTVSSMYIHVHDFSEPKLVRQPICGQEGVTNAKCLVCGLDSTIYTSPKYKTHSLVKSATTKTSCLSNMGSVEKCEHCAYSRIEQKVNITAHKFDANGVCTVCKLHKPKCNADGSVYEIYDAAEMRVLSELVSIGEVPGNIGIDIKSDLVFSADTTMLPLGDFIHPFQGVLNGNGHRIRGIANCFQGVDCLGFVAVAKGTPLSHAVIANLIFDTDNTMQGTGCIGGIVGYAAYCDIVNCASFGSLEGLNYVGSIVGYADQQVSFHNCASVSSIRTQGNWNPMGCGLPYGHILNSYGAAYNSLDGHVDELLTTTFRHCFTTTGSADGLTQVSPSMMSTYNMLELLNEESESPTFMMSQDDPFPIPVVDTSIQASPNRAIETSWKAGARRALSSDLMDDEEDDEKTEILIIGGYVDESAIAALGSSIEEVISQDSVLYADYDRTYVVTHSLSDGEELEMFERMGGGDPIGFESYMLSPDSTHVILKEYIQVSPDKVKAASETIDDWSGADERIDEYAIEDGNRTLVSRTIIENEENITYLQKIDGVMKMLWEIKTVYDEEGNAITEVYSHDTTTGETILEYSSVDDEEAVDEGLEDNNSIEYFDSATNTIHIIINDLDSITGAVISREHYVLNADQYLLEIRTEKMINGEPYLSDGLYFVYDDDNGALSQAVAYGPEDANHPGMNLRPYLYLDYLGVWEPNQYPTAIKVPTTSKPSLEKHSDYNVYDTQGRVMRRVTDMRDPFSGLPKGLYIYQGSKYLKRD